MYELSLNYYLDYRALVVDVCSKRDGGPKSSFILAALWKAK
jgi:hypothetical protein